jgi:two-component system LytT family response regulator
MLELIAQPSAVIFTTAFDEYAIKAFETHAIDYLLKPFSQERFDKAVQKWLSLPPNTSPTSRVSFLATAALSSPLRAQRIVVKNGTKIKIIPAQEIQYLEAADDCVKIHTAEGAFLKTNTMAHFEQLLDAAQFVRCHRSFIVNIHAITRIDPYEKDSHVAILKSGAKVPVSKSGYPKLREVLGL